MELLHYGNIINIKRVKDKYYLHVKYKNEYFYISIEIPNNFNLTIRIATRYCCYVLKSKKLRRNSKSQTFDKTYVGYTVNPERRIRQHNGLILGGAKKTRKFKPWEYLMIIRGFPDSHSALQFEWRCHHPRLRVGNKLIKYCNTHTNVETRIKIISKILNLDHWTPNAINSNSVFLEVNWILEGYKLDNVNRSNIIELF